MKHSPVSSVPYATAVRFLLESFSPPLLHLSSVITCSFAAWANHSLFMDDDLEAVRQRRMMELMAQGGGQMGGMGGVTQEGQQEQEEKKRAAEDQRQGMLAAVMMPDARERLARIALVKPDKARGVENMILGAAQRGALGEKVSDARLMSMLEQINERQESAKPKITIQRRRPVFDDDD